MTARQTQRKQAMASRGERSGIRRREARWRLEPGPRPHCRVRVESPPPSRLPHLPRSAAGGGRPSSGSGSCPSPARRRTRPLPVGFARPRPHRAPIVAARPSPSGPEPAQAPIPPPESAASRERTTCMALGVGERGICVEKTTISTVDELATIQAGSPGPVRCAAPAHPQRRGWSAPAAGAKSTWRTCTRTEAGVPASPPIVLCPTAKSTRAARRPEHEAADGGRARVVDLLIGGPIVLIGHCHYRRGASRGRPSWLSTSSRGWPRA